MRPRSVWCLLKKTIHDHMHMGKCLLVIQGLLTPLQKQERVKCAKALLTMYQDSQEDFFDRLITQNETWAHHYESV